MLDLHARRQLALDLLDLRATRPMTSSELALGSTHTPMNTAFSPVNRTSWS